jgi:beta-phosphoglucomutase-like phosphatase (HAD superfamily)
VLQILELEGAFDTVATRDDVERGKPDPEIYRLVLDRLGEAPADSLVIEDSPTGVRAAMRAGAEVIAVATPFTREGLHALEQLPKGRIVDDPGALMATVDRVFAQLSTPNVSTPQPSGGT